MKHIYMLFLVLAFPKAFGQDIILLKDDNELVRAKIVKISHDKVQYHRHDNLEGPLYEVPTNLIKKISFENGTEQIFQNSGKKAVDEPNYSLSETKEYIVKIINEHGYEEDSFKHPYQATFEGKYLRLVEMNKDRTKPKNKGILFDFSNVYKFEKVSKRSDKLSFVNIWVSIIKNEKKMKFDKHKLIMRVDDHHKAESILKALKYYNSLLLEKSKSDDKF